MKSRVVRLVVLYLAALAIMVVGHIIFMACLPGIYSSIPWSDRMAAVGAGLKIDRSIAAYLTIIPGLIAVMSIWLLPVVTDRITRAYYAIVAPIVAGAMTLDTLLYSYWGMKLDTTPFFYFASSPRLAMASAPWWQIAAAVAAWIAGSAAIYLIFRSSLRLTPITATQRPLRTHRPAPQPCGPPSGMPPDRLPPECPECLWCRL